MVVIATRRSVFVRVKCAYENIIITENNKLHRYYHTIISVFFYQIEYYSDDFYHELRSYYNRTMLLDSV